MKEFLQNIRETHGTLVLNLEQTAQELNCSPNHVRQLVRAGKLKRVPNEFRMMIPATEIAKHLEVA